MQRWVVITNITVMAGLSVHLFCSSVIFFFLFILASVTKQNYTGSQLKGPSCLSDKRAINIAAIVDT